MFKNNLYAFSALIALTCGAYAMGDDLSSSEVTKSGRSALRASTNSLVTPDQEPDAAKASSSSPASSTPSSLFSDDAKQVAPELATLRAELEALKLQQEEEGKLYAKGILELLAQQKKDAELNAAAFVKQAMQIKELVAKEEEAKQLATEHATLKTELEELARSYAELYRKHIAQDRELAAKKEEAKQLAAELEKLRAESEVLKAEGEEAAKWYVQERAKLKAQQ